MGSAGFTEILLLAVIALIVVGPQKLPMIARTAGRLARQARNAWQGLQSELQAELDADHNRKIMESTRDKADPAPTDVEPSAPKNSATSDEHGKRDESAGRN